MLGAVKTHPNSSFPSVTSAVLLGRQVGGPLLFFLGGGCSKAIHQPVVGPLKPVSQACGFVYHPQAMIFAAVWVLFLIGCIVVSWARKEGAVRNRPFFFFDVWKDLVLGFIGVFTIGLMWADRRERPER